VRNALRFLLAGFGLFMAAALHAAPLPLLVKRDTPYFQRITIVTLNPEGVDAAIAQVNLKWIPQETKPGELEQMQFLFGPGTPPHAAAALRQQLWTALIDSAFAWQEGWRAAKWELPDAPYCDPDGSGAALAVGLLATAAGVEIPAGVTVLGGLLPDGSFTPVPRIERRLEVASRSGIRTIILPASQRITESSPGYFVDVEARARQLGLEPVFAADLADAIPAAIRHRLPAEPAADIPPACSGPTFAFLLERCRAQIISLNKSRPDWPTSPEALSRVNPGEIAAWRKVFRDYETGTDAFKAGKLYAAHCRFRDAISGISVLAAQRRSADAFDPVAYREKCKQVRQAIADRIGKDNCDRADVQSALLVAENTDVLSRMDRWLEGAQVAVSQTFAADSRATPVQQTAAQFVMRYATDSSAHQLANGMNYADLLPLVVGDRQVSAYDRAPVWLLQLQPAQLALAEYFSEHLRAQANAYGVDLLFDPMLAAQSQINRRLKDRWERGRSDVEAAAPTNAADTVQGDIGFIPGPAYGTTDDTTPRDQRSRLSDPARVLSWVNGYSEIAVLRAKYLLLGGSLDVANLEWTSKQRAQLGVLLESAEIGARRAITLARRVNLDPAVLSLIYEHAAHLRDSGHDELRLEALRQFWRCGLLGNLAFQLAYIPRVAAPVRPGNATAGVETVPPPGNPSPDPVAPPEPSRPPRAVVVRPANVEPPPAPAPETPLRSPEPAPEPPPVPEPGVETVPVPSNPMPEAPAAPESPTNAVPESPTAPVIPKAQIIRPAAPETPNTNAAPSAPETDGDGTQFAPGT
jgi:hypothetical protein